MKGYAYPCGKSSWCQSIFPSGFWAAYLGVDCGKTVGELLGREGDYRESVSALRLPKPLKLSDAHGPDGDQPKYG